MKECRQYTIKSPLSEGILNTLVVRTVICSDKSIKVKQSDKDGRVDSCRDGFIFGCTIQLTKIDVSKDRLQPELEPQNDCNHLPFSPLSFSSSSSPLLSFTPSPPLSLPSCLPSSLSVELIDYVSSIHLSLCRLATGALSGVEGGSFTRGGVGGYKRVGWVGGIKQKPIALDSTFILTDTCFPFAACAWGFTVWLMNIQKGKTQLAPRCFTIYLVLKKPRNVWCGCQEDSQVTDSVLCIWYESCWAVRPFPWSCVTVSYSEPALQKRKSILNQKYIYASSFLSPKQGEKLPELHTTQSGCWFFWIVHLCWLSCNTATCIILV